MAFLKDLRTDFASPIVYTDPRDGDLVIDGTAYDIATMLPKMGKNIIHNWDQSLSPTDQIQALLDVDSFHRHAPLCDLADWYRMGTAFSVNHPFCQRYIEDGRTATADLWKNAWYTRFDMRGRDWLEDPVRIHNYHAPTTRYYTTNDNNVRSAQLTVYDAGDNKPIGQEQRYSTAAVSRVSATYGMTDHGLVGSGPYNFTSGWLEALYRHDFASDSNLEFAGATQLYTGTTNQRQTMTKLCQLDNGDIIFSLQFTTTVRVLRYVNSTGAVTVESTRAKSYNITTLPSNVVRHGTSGTQKISLRCREDTNNPTTMNFECIQMDVATGSVTVTDFNPTNSGATGATQTISEPDGNYVGNYWETRIISPNGQSPTSEKFVMFWHGSMSLDDQSSQAAWNDSSSERWIYLGVITDSNGQAITWRENYTWDSLLTTSTRNTNGADKVPWCVAPLNPEHTLMMVFCQYSTHIIKFSHTGSGASANPILEEVWFDENTIFTQAMWLPTGKVLTLEWDERFRHGTGDGLIDDHNVALQVWSEDQIYKLDVLPDTQYVAYAGSNLSANVGFNAYDANNELISTSLKVEITGPAQFDNGTALKTFSTSASANTVQTITITDDGQIEFRVLEVQSI